MAAKKGKDTLKDLSNFLKDQGSPEAEDSPKGDADSFLSSKPSTLVNVSKLQEALGEAHQDPNESFLVEAVQKLAEMENRPVREVLFSLVEAVFAKSNGLSAADLMLLTTVQYLSHSQQVDNKLTELLKD